METVIHLGAYRTQAAAEMRDVAAAGPWVGDVLIWAPPMTRRGVLAGLLGDPSRGDRRSAARARGRVALRCEEARRDGAATLLLIEPRLLGTARECLSMARLFPTARARLVRAARALPPIRRCVLTIREPAAWWGAVITDAVARGAPVPAPPARDAIAKGRRGWRDVIEDVARAVPDAERRVIVPEARDADHAAAIFFDPRQRAAMAARYAADVEWLRAGADGAARLWTSAPQRRILTSADEGIYDGRRDAT